jgi:light-regulated signal transduction histidine kinase (bacteriophytochrome)
MPRVQDAFQASTPQVWALPLSVPNPSTEASAGNVGLDLTACDREPIHVPGSIQPHGLLLIADARSFLVVAGAGDIENRLEPNWLGKHVDDLLHQEVAALVQPSETTTGSVISPVPVRGLSEVFSISLHRSGGLVLVEMEPASDVVAYPGSVLAMLDNAGSVFSRSPDLNVLCQEATSFFRELTGFDRVMMYRFLENDVGCVVAEAKASHLGSFLHHHFPASDIPRQARALYIRNRVRVIPDVTYQPAPMRPVDAGYASVDLSDVGLRSVSPIHVQYLKNMGVAASASISIVKDGLLWGLIACHNLTPRQISYDTRVSCRALASSVARQIRAKEEAETYRERLRLRSAEDGVVAHLDREGFIDQPDAETRHDMRLMLDAEGFVSVRGSQVDATGKCPGSEDVLRLVRWLSSQPTEEPFRTSNASSVFPPASAYSDVASGILAISILPDEASFFIWFRAERVQIIDWAGNPHKPASQEADQALTPRKSFEAWSETVRGQSRRWTLAEVESAYRLRNEVLDARQNRRLKDLNKELAATIEEKDGLLRLKDYLVKEVNHRVQNSLQLVSSFLRLQARSANEPAVTEQLEEAQRRLSAVALVHKRLYRDDNFEAIDLARYLEDLCVDMRETMGAAWDSQFVTHFAPILISADRALNLGLVLTELIINANKYAYAGKPGPLSINLEQQGNHLRLTVADRGASAPVTGKGFGARMMKAMVGQLAGTIEHSSNEPGLRVTVSAPIEVA